ncbi:hypothetical protein HQ870_12425, partial [Enterococcus faecium]|nr:hypothetical protein [Enterococcus faecium]
LYTKLENEGRNQVVKEIKKSLEKILKDIKEKASEYEKIKNNFILKSENSITNFEKTNVNLIE